ncbi:hypothetical protein Dsin_002286 [Dipteronia sinensis]|uniref:WRKY domain-containing protein n=1 Tax=Dipteronia sinensis TaxID=43782 RepID=A0AAE0B6W9_9ROSI|nr:hypothetical protein Dsin_002286 [Dipteronia sinensis]
MVGGGGGVAALFSDNMVSLNRKNKAIEGLVEGKQFAGRLQVLLLQKPFGGDGSSAAAAAAEELAGKILRSFIETLSVLGGGGETTSSAGEVVEEESDSLVSGGRRLEESGESKKRLMVPKGRRGCYKRQKNSETRRMVTPNIEDGHAWRKYGQKDILNTTYPRSYFRCTHKYEQGCKATKQVQKMEDNPQMYETIYIGNHTCRSQMSLTSTPQMIITDINGGPWGSSSSVISSPSSSTAVVVKQEYNLKEETLTQISNGDDLSENLSSSHHGDHEQQMEYFSMWDDLVPLDHHHHHHHHHHRHATTTTTCHQENFHIDFDSDLCFEDSDLFLSS